LLDQQQVVMLMETEVQLPLAARRALQLIALAISM
jgi:hypothetical protein